MKGLLLLSGGIDSPVAGHLMNDNGVEIIAVHFDNQPFSSSKASELAQRLAKKIGVKKLYIVDYGKSKSEIVKNCIRKYTCVLCRRLMFRIAEAIAKTENCDFLVTGENLGQVASQTLQNMISEHSASQILVLRPLLCNDKMETVEIAKRIGTYEISIEPSICCTLVPECPATKSSISVIETLEKRMDVQEIVRNSVKTARIIR
ncbi:7-cyano-7-deazaguanine synthase [Candidatus Woesearchaeota archaeon]|nr:7-cyano-7-deazaguanine synthase [Candidatus Woesearchaeota archaeon]MBW3022398.1 7-cyano-7-deazaguanine synthase [Candidatus Woesearchaeota archaeon]